MGKLILALLKKPLVLVGLGLLCIAFLGAAAWGVHQTQVPPAQPIQFPHNVHVNLGIQCLYCHPGALRGPSPGLPTEAKCYACHQQISVTNPELNKLFAYVKDDKPIPWVPVAILPDFVYFSHRPHLAAGLNCEDCHGEVSRMTVAVPQKMDMGWCLSCHRARAKNNPELLAKLTDCATCHK